MARSTNTMSHPDGSNVNITSGAAAVTIYTSSIITIPANSGITLSGSFGVSDSAPGYVVGSVDIKNSDTNATIGSAGQFLAYGAGTATISASIQNPSGTPLNIQLVANAGSYIASTTARVTGFTTSTIELYPKETIGIVTIPDNNPSYPNYGIVVGGTSGTNWMTILTENIPAGNLLTAIGLPFNSIKESGTTPIFEYQILKNGVVVDTFDFNPAYNQSGQQLGIRYAVETTEATTILIRVRCKSAGGATSINSHRSVIILRFDLDQIGRLSKHIVETYTPVSTTMLKTPPLDSPVGNKIFRIICSNIAANDYFYRSVRYRNSDTFETAVGGTYAYPDALHGADISSGASLEFNPAQATDVSNPRGDFHYGMFEQPSGADKTTLTYEATSARDQKLRPGSAIYLLDLSAEVAPTEEYDPINYLEIS